MDELTLKTVELEEQYQNHMHRLDEEFKEAVSKLRMDHNASLEALAKKEKEKVSFSSFFKGDKNKKDAQATDKSKEEQAKENPPKELTDEEKLAEKEKLREEEKLNKKPKKEEPVKEAQPPKISRKQQALQDKHKADIKDLLEKFNFKSGDVHDLFVQKIIDLEKSYGVTVVRDVTPPKEETK